MKNDTRYEYLTTGKKKCSALPNSVKKNMEEGVRNLLIGQGLPFLTFLQENEWSNRDRELIGDILRYYRQSLTLNPSLFVAHDNIGLIMEMVKEMIFFLNSDIHSRHTGRWARPPKQKTSM